MTQRTKGQKVKKLKCQLQVECSQLTHPNPFNRYSGSWLSAAGECAERINALRSEDPTPVENKGVHATTFTLIGFPHVKKSGLMVTSFPWGSLGTATLPLTSSMETVRQGKCLLVSLIFKALAFWAVFKARDRFSDVSSK